jgi:hypothetical protein
MMTKKRLETMQGLIDLIDLKINGLRTPLPLCFPLPFCGRPRGHAPTDLLTDTVPVPFFIYSFCFSFTQSLMP